MAKDTDISQLLKDKRKQWNLSQKQMGQIMTAHHGAISAYENRDRLLSAEKMPFLEERLNLDLGAELDRLNAETSALDALRMAKGWSIEQLAEASGVNRHLLYDILRSGFYAKPHVMDAIAKVLEPTAKEVVPLTPLAKLSDKDKLALADAVIDMVRKLGREAA